MYKTKNPRNCHATVYLFFWPMRRCFSAGNFLRFFIFIIAIQVVGLESLPPRLYVWHPCLIQMLLHGLFELSSESLRWYEHFQIILFVCFRKYEWKKHGTCAAKASSLNSQHKYFSKALELYHTLDLDRYKPLTYLHVYTYANTWFLQSSSEKRIQLFYVWKCLFLLF